MSSAAQLRPLAPEDLPALQEIRRRAFAPVFSSFREIVGAEIAAVALKTADAEQAQLLDTICAAESKHTVLVVTVDGAIVGFVSYTLDSNTSVGEIGLNAVDPAHAGKGIGAAMYEHVLGRMRAAGMRVATVGTGGDKSHAPARRAYEKVGFGPAIPSLSYYRTLQ